MTQQAWRKTLEMKKKAKENLYKICWPEEKTTTPLLMIFAPTDKASREVLFKMLEGCLVLPSNIIVVSKDNPPDAVKHPVGKITWVSSEEMRRDEKLEKYSQAADMAVLFEEHMAQIKELMRQGIVLIGHEKSPLLENYNPNRETGNSFTYSKKNPWDIFMALVRAHETYHFPYDWQNIVRNVEESSKN